MQIRKMRVASLIAAAALAGVSARAFGQYTIAGSYSFGPTGNVGTDDTGTSGTGNAVTYTSMLLQSYASPSQEVLPGSYIQGAGAPYEIGTLGYKIQTGTGFLGPSYSTGTTAFYYSPSTGFNYFGQYDPSTTLQYRDDGATTNWSTGSPSTTFVSTNFHSVSLSGENSAGVAIGYEGIQAADSGSSGTLGQNAFAFNISNNTAMSLGFTSMAIDSSGASYSVNFNYSNVNSGVSQGTYRSSIPFSIDSQGDISGESQRYFAFGGATLASSPGGSGSLGVSCWYYNAASGTTSISGLYGPGYSYQKNVSSGSLVGTGTFASQIDAGVNGQYEVGRASLYVDNGNGTGTTVSGFEAWEYSAATNTTTPISLYQSGMTPNVAGFGSTYNGSALTYSYSSNGGVARSSSIAGLNSNGLVAGTSSYYNTTGGSIGTDAWIYNPGTTSYQQVGLLSNGFNLSSTAVTPTTSFVSSKAQRSSTIASINTAGASTGYSTEYLSANANGSSSSTTNVAWYTAPNSAVSVPIGPSDPWHTATSATLGTYVNETATIITDTGLVAGSATRYAPGTTTTDGSDAWIYNTITGQYSILDPNPDSLTNFSSQISYLAPNGVAVGEYKSGTETYEQAFVWSPLLGFEDLTSMTSMTDPNITQLTDAYSYNPATGQIFTSGQYVSAGTVETPGGGVAVLNGPIVPVPEPASLALAGGLAAIGLLRRRR